LQSWFPSDVGQYLRVVGVSCGVSRGASVALTEDSFCGYFSVNILYLLHVLCIYVPSVKLKEILNMFHMKIMKFCQLYFIMKLIFCVQVNYCYTVHVLNMIE
jgi:hypothetical protein